jgi:endogenous inhibitor of DNA gyrase (YacG/DUF329 family)
MGMVMVRCPITGNEIATGIETEPVILEALPKVETAVRCPECGEKHFWTIEHAYIAGEPRQRAAA